ncbi:MAG: DNA modification methylase, partial [Caulobacteraceae bacterium]|nr:DNA modification methylase [Caulobacteraceae bacterium]
MIAADLIPLAFAVDKLRLLPGNPRRGNVEAVKRSLAAFGQRKPIVARRSDRVVIAGNHTLQAAQALGWTEVAVVWVDDDDTTSKAFALADNRTAELGDYDEAALADLIGQVGSVDPELLKASGWDEASVAELVASLEPDVLPLAGDPDDVPEQVSAKSVLGDVWLLGPHRLMCGDSTSPTDVDNLMAGSKADMVWTDPPYGVDYVGKTKDALKIKNDRTDDTAGILDGAFASLLSASKAGAAVYVAAPSGPAGNPFAVKLFDLGIFRQRLVWVKDVMVLGHSDYHYRHEDIYFGYTPNGKGRKGRGGEGWYGDHSQTTVLEFSKPRRNAEHPTMKPIELIEYCFSNSSRPKDKVLDLFGGSGSTLIAAHKTNRVAYLMELDPKYVDVICARFQKLTGIKPVN